MLVINIIPPTKAMEDNPFINKEDTPMLVAHRGGSISNPENTLKAYNAAVNEYEADILETDLWLTKDGYLVLNHDGILNRTCDVELFTGSEEEKAIEDYTLEELRNFNFGYDFKNAAGEFPYRNITSLEASDRKEVIKNNKLSVVTINDLFAEFYTTNKDLLFIVEIKNPGEQGYKAANILDDVLTNSYPDYKNRVVIGTFHNEIEADLKNNHPTLLRGASTSVATKFLITQMLHVNIFDNDSFACLQIPTSEAILDLTWETYISRAHQRNIAVQYWTINDEAEMRKLIGTNCDAIMTDDPALLRRVLNEYK